MESRAVVNTACLGFIGLSHLIDDHHLKKNLRELLELPCELHIGAFADRASLHTRDIGARPGPLVFLIIHMREYASSDLGIIGIESCVRCAT